MKTLTKTVLALVGAGTLTMGTLAATASASTGTTACGDHEKQASKPVPADAKTLTLKVGGMTCDGCANTVRNALLKVDGVYDATVDWETGATVVQFDGKKTDDAKLGDAIIKAGYTVEKPKS